MIYRICQKEDYDVTMYQDHVEIGLPKLEYLYTMSSEDIIKELLRDNNMIRLVSRSEDVYNNIVDYIINDYSKEELFDILVSNNVPLFSLALNSVEFYKKKYKIIKNYKEAKVMYIDANLDNINDAFYIASDLSCDVIINGNNISLYDYKLIFDNYDLSIINKSNIKINYQDQNTPISPYKLKDLANKVYCIVDDLKKSKLSPIEKVMYVYDTLKKRVYGRTSDIKDERDVDRVISGDKMVCSGYSNLFNAILNCLDIKSVPIISNKIRHQRSMAYIRDPKYNIDGVYVFDPTWDREIDGDINSYDYFAMSFMEASKTFPSDYDKIFLLSFDDIINYVNSDNDKEVFDFLQDLSFLCNIINNKLANEYNIAMASIDNEVKKELYINYLLFMVSYKVKTIDYITFSKIIYNVKRFEYYNDKCNDLDVDDIKGIVIDRCVNIKRREFKEEENVNAELLLFRLIKYNLELDEILDNNFGDFVSSSIKGSDSVEKDALNIKLIKLLRKKSNSK